MTNAMVELGLVSLTLVLGILGLSAFFVGAMVVTGMLWWGYVHGGRVLAMMKTKPASAIGSLAIAWLTIVVVYGVAFGVGGALHSAMGL